MFSISVQVDRFVDMMSHDCLCFFQCFTWHSLYACIMWLSCDLADAVGEIWMCLALCSGIHNGTWTVYNVLAHRQCHKVHVCVRTHTHTPLTFHSTTHSYTLSISYSPPSHREHTLEVLPLTSPAHLGYSCPPTSWPWPAVPLNWARGVAWHAF